MERGQRFNEELSNDVQQHRPLFSSDTPFKHFFAVIILYYICIHYFFACLFKNKTLEIFVEFILWNHLCTYSAVFDFNTNGTLNGFQKRFGHRIRKETERKLMRQRRGQNFHADEEIFTFSTFWGNFFAIYIPVL